MNEHPHHLLAAYVDQELKQKEAEAIERHVRGCALCQAQVQEFMALRGLLAAAPLPNIAPANAFWQRLAPQLPPQRPALGMGWVWGGAMTLVAAISEIILVALAVTGALRQIGISPLAGLPLSWSGQGSVATALQLLLDTTLAGWVLTSPLAPLLPYLFLLLLLLTLTFCFLGWGLAALGRARAGSGSVPAGSGSVPALQPA